MATTGVKPFTASLADLDVSVSRTDAATAPAAIDDAVVEPAIGAALDIEGVSLADTAVETELTPRRLHEAGTGVTRADRAVAAYGSLLIRSDAAGTEPLSLYPPNHVAVLRASDVCDDVEASVDRLDEIFGDGGSAVFATGASSTGDMGALVEGVHGPKHVHVVLVEDR
ncbi:LUD domain-containing protein [Halococcus hamelinensis]|uniref:LUD domain-containing protein n=1 Tax=Halococcus hamelinensis 100A6 TaxID=1132509 RepID=M0M797_9EURY|nr:LUD domain-containing protein [Halococcus hamelinensis]EMA40479.1 hypothetical protein C447_04247 [Halococcus hamelinensis 100A6]